MIALLGMARMVPAWCYWLLALVALCLGCEMHGRSAGERSVQAKWNAAELTRANAEKSAVLARVAENQAIFKRQELDAEKLTKAHDDELAQVRATIANAPRLRIGSALCGGSASTAKAESAGSGNAADPGGRLVREDLGRDIDALKLRVEEGFAAGRTCQAFARVNGMAP